MALAPKCHLNRGSQAGYRWNPPGSFGTPGPGFLARCLLALIWVISRAFQSSPRGSNTQRPLGADLDKGNQFSNHCVSRQSCRHGDSNEMFVCMWELPLLLAEPIFQRLATQWAQESPLDKQSPAGDGACSHAGDSCAPQLPGLSRSEDAHLHVGTYQHKHLQSSNQDR